MPRTFSCYLYLVKLNLLLRTAAWFGDLGDGIHKGDQNDPRVAVIEVIPDEVRFWISTESAVAKAANIVTSAVTGKVAAPGDLCTLTKAEVRWLSFYFFALQLTMTP